MIWNTPRSGRDSERPLVSHIKNTIETNSVAGHSENSSAQAEEIAKAVSAFLAEHDLTDSFIDAGYLVMLASRAISSVGDKTNALRLVVFGTGMVRPSEWEVTGGEEVWTVDLKQMTVKDNSSLELIVFNSLNIVLNSIAEIWDSSHGKGVLGLRHVCATAAALLGVDKNTKAVSNLSDEIQSLCTAKLRQISKTRDWKSVPEVMNLDVK